MPRKVGGAVDRNAVKRRLREAVARNEGLLGRATDYVLVARPGLAAAAEAQGFDWLCDQVAELLTAAAAEAAMMRDCGDRAAALPADAADAVPDDGRR